MSKDVKQYKRIVRFYTNYPNAPLEEIETLETVACDLWAKMTPQEQDDIAAWLWDKNLQEKDNINE